ncbi:MAG: type II/IV secretion system ATPase subunit [Candidatus Altiarchaeota archaeon]|nr:type II/IV secretion system ATPase subunit [Candidatus Altiarchaeota archaeon]
MRTELRILMAYTNNEDIKKAKRASLVLKKLIKKMRHAIKTQVMRYVPNVQDGVVDKILESENQEIERATRQVMAEPARKQEIMNDLVRRVESKVPNKVAKHQQVAPSKITSRPLKHMVTPVRTVRRLEDTVERLEKTVEKQETRQEKDENVHEFVQRIKIIGNIPNMQGMPKKGERLGAKVGESNESRYMVPFGFMAPMYKRMTGPQIIEKVQELYHVPFEAGDKIKQTINVKYPLTPEVPKKGEKVYAWAHIAWDSKNRDLVYNLIEPKLTPYEAKILKGIETKLEQRLDVLFVPERVEDHRKYLKEKTKEMVDLFGWSLTPEQAEKIEYFIVRDFIGFGLIEPLMHDGSIEDISCDGINIPVYIFHRKPEYGQIRSTVFFKTKGELDSFVIKLAQRCGKSISVAQPLLDGSLPDGSRLQATLGGDIARRGSNFTIRKFTKEPLTPTHLMDFGTANSTVLSYLWMCLEYGKSMLISGATATGKTSFLNAISLFIRPELKIVSIEDTAELRLPLPNWIPHISRIGFSESGYGSIEMYDLLKASLRQRPDYVIVGEVRGKEASVMFQGMATGHPGLSTIHADSLQRVVDRLTTAPINLSVALLENLDLLIFLARTKIKGKFVRRVAQISEVTGVDIRENEILPNQLFKWDPVKDEIELLNQSAIIKKIAEFKGMDYDTVFKEIERRAMFLEWLKLKGIRDFKQFALWIKSYYNDPEKIMRQVSTDLQKIVKSKA